MEDNKYSIEKLNSILQKNFDAEKAFKRAADDVKNESLQKYFQHQAIKRSKFATDLTTEILGLGGEPVENGSTAENFQRTWMDLKSAVSQNNEEAILKECKRLDKASLEEYNDALALQKVTTASFQLLENQKALIEADLNKINSLEDVSNQYG